MNTIDTIMTRRSYRGKYKNQPVPREDLQKILEAGLAAPSGCNKQTTSLICVDKAEILKKINSVIEPPVCETAPAMICVLSQKINAYRDRCFAVQDYSAAIENMILAIVELGYQSCWYEGHITDTDRICDKIAEILNVPDDYDLVCILPVGIAESEPSIPRKKAFEERAWFNGFCAKGYKMEKKYLLVIITILFCTSLFSEDLENLIPKKTKTENEYFIPGNEGDIIYSLGEGVVDIGFDNIKGLYIIADYNSLGIKVTYCNLGTISVSKKQKIKKGDKLGSIGMTGYTDQTGCSMIIEINEDSFLFQKKMSEF